MTNLIRRFRGVGVALVALAISAGAVFAAAPHFSPVSDSQVASETTTETTTETTVTTTTGGAEDGDQDGDEDANGDTTTTETSDDAGATDTHGELVSTAAHMPLDPRFTNRGKFVSCVAKLGKDVLASTVDWAQVTEDCVTAQAARDAAKQARHDAAKASAEGGKARSDAPRTRTHGKPKG